jgi:hypothetical protein
MSTAWKDRRGGWYHEYRKRRAVFMDDNALHNGGECQLHIAGVCTGTATTVHHVLGIGVDKLDVRYWKAACAKCNARIGDPNRRTQPAPRTITRWKGIN